MPNAAANFDDDFGLDAPARKKPAARRPAPGKGKGARGKKKGKRAFRIAFDMQRVGRWSAIGMSALIALGIMVNALMMQTGHHPAPLFGTSIALGDPKPAPAPVAAARVPAKPQPAASAPITPPAPAARTQPASDSADAAAGDDDPIAKLLSGATVAADHADSKTVIGAQRALAKLGFSVKATGTLGPQTKKAIESFEKDRHLPVKGELSRRVVKILAAESGLKIEH